MTWAQSKRGQWHLDECGVAQCSKRIELYGESTDKPPYHQACTRCYAMDPVYHYNQMPKWAVWE